MNSDQAPIKPLTFSSHGNRGVTQLNFNRYDGRRDMRRLAAFAAIIVGVLAGTPVALAQQPSSGLGEAGGVQGAVGGGAANGTLPFTGLDVVFLLLGGLVLLAVGFGLRAVSRAKS
jgi:hypothetical protein